MVGTYQKRNLERKGAGGDEVDYKGSIHVQIRVIVLEGGACIVQVQIFIHRLQLLSICCVKTGQLELNFLFSSNQIFLFYFIFF